jgi:lysophospholipase L1-like esterase
MPVVYEKADFQETNSQLWNFKQYSPQVVSIALGTNDLSNGDGIKNRSPFDSAIFVRNYITFIQLVKSKYPRAQIALLNSSMAGDKRLLLKIACGL